MHGEIGKEGKKKERECGGSKKETRRDDRLASTIVNAPDGSRKTEKEKLAGQRRKARSRYVTLRR